MSETFGDKLARLNDLRQKAYLGGGQGRIDKIDFLHHTLHLGPVPKPATEEA